MDDELRPILGARFADEVMPLLIESVQASYLFRRDVYSENNGDDSMTFGIGVSRGALNLIERALDDCDDVTAQRPQGSFVITDDKGRQIRCWKVGVTEQDDVESIKWEGSEAKKAPGRANARQLILELEGDTPQPGKEMHLSNLVVGHLGNSIDGCCRIVIGTPKEGQGWHFVRDIWRIAEEDVVRSAADLGYEPILTGDEIDDLPDVKLRSVEEPDPNVVLRSSDADDESSTGSQELA